MQIIKDKTLTTDNWQLIRQTEDDMPILEEPFILPFPYWQTNKELLLKNSYKKGVWLSSDTKVEDIIDDLPHFALIAIDFPVSKDGRPYSTARLLRQRYSYKGELRAIGDIGIDHFFYLQRCGFNSFEIEAEKNSEGFLHRFKDFSICYQAAVDENPPIYKKR